MSASEEDFAEILIAEIQARPALWNCKLPSYKNKRIRDILYSEVGGILGISKEAVAARWKNKKDTFRRELKKIPKSRSGDEAKNIESSWPYFQSMIFLKDLMTPSTKYGNLSSSTQEHEVDDEIEEGSDTQSIIDVTSPHSTISEASASQCASKSVSASSDTRTKKRKRLCDTRDDKFLEIENKKLQLLSQSLVQDTPATECETLNFFKSLIPYMEKFDPLQKLKVRSKIQQVIIDEMSQNETYRSSVPENLPVNQNNFTLRGPASSIQEGTSFPYSSFQQFPYS